MAPKEKDAKYKFGTAGSRPTEDGEGAPNLEDLLERAEPLIEQVHQLYNQYFSGVEKRAPMERRKQLDQLMLSIQMIQKGMATARFKASTLHSKYRSFAEQWDRRLRQKESGN